MKNSHIVSILLFLLSFNVFGQLSDTVIIYDHITVYDTIRVYDTVTVYEVAQEKAGDDFSGSSEKNKNSRMPLDAVLVTDPATNEHQLKFFFQTDTATLSSNSILLSRNTKNSEAMKKEILTVLVSAMLSQANIAQEDQTLPDPLSLQSETQSLPLLGDSAHLSLDSIRLNKMSFGLGISGNGSIFNMRASTLRDIGLSNLGGNLKFDYLINGKWSVGFKFIFIKYKRLDYYEAFDASEYYMVKYNSGYLSNSSVVSTYYIFGNNKSGKCRLYITQGLGYADFNTSDTQFSTKNRYSTDTGVPFGEGTFEHYERLKSFSGVICPGTDFALWSGRLYVELPISINIYNERNYNVLAPDGPISKKDKGFTIYGSSTFINLGYALLF
jgi:hypothetical protein